MFSVNPEVFQDESQQDEWAQKNHHNMWAYIFHTEKWKLIPPLSVGSWPCKAWKGGYKSGILESFIYTLIIQIAAFLIGDFWKSNCRSLSRTCFFSNTCGFLKTNSELIQQQILKCTEALPMMFAFAARPFSSLISITSGSWKKKNTMRKRLPWIRGARRDQKGCCDIQPRTQGGGHLPIELWGQKGKVEKGKLRPGKYQRTFRKLY